MDEWTPMFAVRKEFSLAMANKPHIETLEEYLRECEDQATEESDIPDEEEANEGESAEIDENANPIRIFMRIGHESEVCLPTADKVVEFCKGRPDASLDAIRLGHVGLSGKDGPRSNSVALVIEHGRGGARSDITALEPLPLYRRLMRARSKDPASNRATLWDTEDDEPDAEQQLTFVTNPDAWVFHSLIGTAPYFQVAHLQTTLYRHLLFEPYFDFAVSMEGLPMFHLTFNLPHFTLRTSAKARADQRKWPDGNPLRKYYDVSFLDDKNESGLSSFLYETQVSCTIAGPDEGRWTGYCFVDTYFDEEGDGEAVRSYVQDSLVYLGMGADPFTQGHFEIDRDIATRKPREYFLTVLRFRIQQATNEWIKVVELLTNCGRKWEQTLHPTSGKYPLAEAKKRVLYAKWLSQKLFLDISNTITSCEELCDERIFSCFNHFESANSRPLLRPIRSNIREMRRLRETLKQQADNWANFTSALEINVTVATLNITRVSLAIVVAMGSIGMTINIFSMSKPELVIPFIPENFKSFLFVLAIVSGIWILALATTDPYQHLICKLLPSKYPCWSRKFPISIPSLKPPTLRVQLKPTKKTLEDEENRLPFGLDTELRSLGTTALKPFLKAHVQDSDLTASHPHGFPEILGPRQLQLANDSPQNILNSLVVGPDPCTFEPLPGNRTDFTPTTTSSKSQPPTHLPLL